MTTYTWLANLLSASTMLTEEKVVISFFQCKIEGMTGKLELQFVEQFKASILFDRRQRLV